MTDKNVLLFGSSYMAEEYLKVLKALGCNVFVCGRDAEKAAALAQRYSSIGFGGGVHNIAKQFLQSVDMVIIASSIDSMRGISTVCLEKGVKHILVEKPGALNIDELVQIKKLMAKGVNFKIAYNRRFCNSVMTLKKMIKHDKRAEGCFFDFTDREKDILNSKKSKDVLRKWGLANSSHVIDTAFYLIGLPLKISSLRSGSFDCHPSGSVFVGCGQTKQCLFSYFSTWSGGGRWNIEVSTQKGRYRLCPMEELWFCRKNQFEWVKLDLADSDDTDFKPGLYKMVKNELLGSKTGELPDIDDQIELYQIIKGIFGYND